MWLAALVVTGVLVTGGLYETWALRFHEDWTITALTRRAPHRMLVLFGAAFTILGYLLGRGGA